MAVPQPSCNTVAFSRCLDEIYNKLFFIRLEPSYICPYVFYQLFITVRKRSLGQGNIFRSASHSVRGGGVGGYLQGVCLWGFSSRGVCLWRGGLHPGLPVYMGVCLHGGWTEPMDSEKLVVCILLECFLLPPTNEVRGKVMFLHLSVSHFVHGGCTHPLGRHPQADTPLGRHPLGRHLLPRQTPPPQADTP